MTEEILLNNYLSLLKCNTSLYLNGQIESSNDDLRNIFEKGLKTTLKSQETTFKEMVDYGYYEICNVKTEDIKKTYDKICNC